MNVTIEGLLRQRRLNWVGRINEMPWSRLPKRVLYGMLMERNVMKGTPSSFKSCVKQDLKKFGLLNNGLSDDINLEHWQSLTKPFGLWKTLVAENLTSIFMRDWFSREKVRHNNIALKKQKSSESVSIV